MTSNQQHSNIYVRNIPPHVDESALHQVFGLHGNIISLRLCKSPQPGRNAIAFVKYAFVEQAKGAIANLNGSQMGNSVLEVKFANADAGTTTTTATGKRQREEEPQPTMDNLYVKGLPSSITEESLRAIFSPFGVVASCRVMRKNDSAPGPSDGVALVRMSHANEAAVALQGLQDLLLPGSSTPLQVRYADSAEQKARKAQRGSVPPAASTVTSRVQYSTYVAPETHSQLQYSTPVTQYGYSSGAASYQQNAYDSSGHLVASAPLGGAHMHAHNGGLGVMIGGAGSSGAYDVHGLGGGGPLAGLAHAHNGDMHAMMGRGAVGGGHVGVSLGGSSQVAGQGAVSAPVPASLYVKNMPTTADRLFLYEKFAPFGAILSVKVMMDEQGQCKGIGFVNFADQDCAARAVASLHNIPIGDKLLHVSFQIHRSSRV